jgi:type IV pilus assembly protein PilX
MIAHANPMTSRIARMPDRQKGFVLIMALVFLALLTIIGVTAMSTTSLEEKMAGNMKDRNLAFQAAETALLAAERWYEIQTTKPVFPDTANGLYVTDSTSAVSNWDAVNWSTSIVTFPCTPTTTSGCGSGVAKVNTQPKYIIEDLGELPEEKGSIVSPTDYKGKGSTIARITARGTGGTDAAVSMVQSTYARQF